MAEFSLSLSGTLSAESLPNVAFFINYKLSVSLADATQTTRTWELVTGGLEAFSVTFPQDGYFDYRFKAIETKIAVKLDFKNACQFNCEV